MNPFDWYGPEFLLFYVFFSVLVIGGMIWLRNKNEAGGSPQLDLSDPYLIAYLRGGANEALRVAMVSLVDRKLLKADGTTLKTRGHVTADAVRHPVEKALIEHFKTVDEAKSAFSNYGLEKSCDAYRLRLESARLLPNDSTQRARQLLLIITVLLLVSVA
ncbi:MAG TPA: TIGR04222 domain-containing membrane protein, partial [Blastocatellia bacterium]|nr:TIGR04222 domain-containing membrane protein [Blastocatellia bacterium]